MTQFDSEGFSCVKASGFANKDMSEIGIDAPIADLVGMGKGVAGYLSANPQVVELLRGGSETGLNVSQALSVGQLCKGHAQILVPAGEALDLVAAVVTLDTAAEFV